MAVVEYPEHHPSAFPVAPYTTDRMSASPLTRLSRLALQTPPRDPQCVVQDVANGASDHDVSGLTPSTLQSAAEVEPAEAVVFSGSEHGVQGALPDEPWAPFIQTHAADPATEDENAGHGVQGASPFAPKKLALHAQIEELASD